MPRTGMEIIQETPKCDYRQGQPSACVSSNGKEIETREPLEDAGDECKGNRKRTDGHEQAKSSYVPSFFRFALKQTKLDFLPENKWHLLLLDDGLKPSKEKRFFSIKTFSNYSRPRRDPGRRRTMTTTTTTTTTMMMMMGGQCGTQAVHSFRNSSG